MDPRTDAWLRLSMTPGLGARGYRALLRVLARAELDLAAFFDLSLARQTALWQDAAQQFSATVRDPRHALPDLSAIPTPAQVQDVKKALLALNCQWIGSESPLFPRRLINDLLPPPPVLFWQGNLALLDQQPTAGIVGTVAPSRLGHNAARLLGRVLGEGGWTVVSGLAKGCDQAGHWGALHSGGATAAFLPQGMLTLDMPPALRAFEHEERFLILSTWPPLTAWGGTYAVRRDALIAEASDGLIAVEMSGRGGGTRHTVNFARERQRPVWTLAHRRTPQNALGNPYLIKTGAQPLHLDERGEVADEDLQQLLAGLKRELVKGKKRRRAMQLEMFE